MQKEIEARNRVWHEISMALDSILQEYRAICDEWENAELDNHRDEELRARASACVDEYLAIIQTYQANAQRRHQEHTQQ